MKLHSAEGAAAAGTAGRNASQGEMIGRTKIELTGQLKVLNSLAKSSQNPDKTRCVLIQHVLPTTIEYVEVVNSVYPVDLVVSIVYSNHQGTVEKLRRMGFEVLVPPSIEYMKNELWKDVARVVAARDAPTVLQEVGGYMSEWTHELAKLKNFKGCVEDTKGGLWRYQAARDGGRLKLPVLSMADTALKKVEDSLIGDACVYSLEKVLRTQLASILDGVRCGVIGWGNIGKSCATAFEGRNSVVSIYDINPVVNMLAYGRGFYPMPLARLLAESDIVMGCSGRRSVRVADIPDIKNGALLCSASSKDIEFDLVGFSKICDIEEISTDAGGMCPIDKYTVRDTGKHFYILKKGTPIDFLDMPLQGAILDCTFSELFVCMRELSLNPHSPGIVELADGLQLEVAKEWLPTYAELFSSESAKADKTFFFPKSLDWQ